MRVKHPYALDDDGPSPDGSVHWGGRRRLADVDDDGIFEVPDDAEHNLDEWAEGYGYDLQTLIVENGAAVDSGEGSTETSDGSDSDDAPRCAGTTAAGDPCTREVDEPGGYCYQHGDD